MRMLIVMFVLFNLITACAQKKESTFESINTFSSAKRMGECDKKLEEISGLVASIKNPGYFWAHNDSGNDADVFLINEKSKIVLTCKLTGILNRDWEDIAIGPGPEAGKNYIYVADIGDNEAIYQIKYIYRFEEPVFSSQTTLAIANVDRISFQLEGAKKDTETLLLDPMTKDLFVISKREMPVYVYHLSYPQSTTDTLTARSVLSLPMKQVVAGDISFDRKEIVVKNYNEIFYWKITPGEDLVKTMAQPPVTIPYKPEPQGEAIAWAHDGSGFYTVSEKNKDKKSFLFFFERK